MIPEENVLDGVTNEINDFSFREETLENAINEYNHTSSSDAPSSAVDADQSLPRRAKEQVLNQASVPKITKKSEELELNRNKVLSEARESKETINVVFIGHVDAGKSTIGGHLLFLTGTVDKRTLEKYEKEAREKNRESWYFSWALDTNQEERDKGKTVEVGKAYFETPHKRFVLLDAPGHRAYVPNMISGAAQADVAVLVISARKGEFETGFDKGGQTREHAQIAKISGIKFMVIVVNKMDDVTVKWSEERYKEICERLGAYLKKIGWKSSEIYFMPISGFTGANLKEAVSSEVCSWWLNKPSLLDYFDKLSPINQDIESPAMVIVSDKYKDMGTVILGKVLSGCFTKNDSFTIMPGQKQSKVCNIMTLDDEEKTMAKIGENIKLRLLIADATEVMPGYVLCHPSNLCSVGRVFDAQLVIIECKSIITSGFKAIIHIHNIVDEITFTSIIKVMDRKTQEWLPKAPVFVKQDNICIIRLTLDNPQCIAPFSTTPYLSRLSLRDEGKTIAFGKIIKVIS